jgi:hypothetical protein
MLGDVEKKPAALVEYVARNRILSRTLSRVSALGSEIS